MSSIIVVGGGIVGLAVADRLARRGHDVTLLEKEPDIALHQTGRNSGVIHSGLYYKPGSHKATMCLAGAASMKRYAREHGVAMEETGKLVVAVRDGERGQLSMLQERGIANGVPLRRISASEAREYEPNVSCVDALRVESTGIIDYAGVSRSLADSIEAHNGELALGESFRSAHAETDAIVVETSRTTRRADLLVNCAGLYSDRVAAASGVQPEVRIVPFRGEYFELRPELHDLVRGLIYPVPDPAFPFLGVHLTKMIDGSVHAGPNAVLAFAREGYRWRDVHPRELALSLTWPGLWRLGARNMKAGAQEMMRSASRSLFAKSLATLVPGIRADDLVPAKAGVRAQAMHRDGSLVDDFYIQRGPRQLHVLNAPSPAATASLEIAAHVEDEISGALA